MYSKLIFPEEQLLFLGWDLLVSTATTLTATLTMYVIYMMNHPGVQRKIQKEMDKVVGRNRLPTLNDRPMWVGDSYTSSFAFDILQTQYKEEMHNVKLMTIHMHPSYLEKKNIVRWKFFFILAYIGLHTSNCLYILWRYCRVVLEWQLQYHTYM